MTKTDQLNLASDLRRTAYFIATDSNSKLSHKLLGEIKKRTEVKAKINIDFNLSKKLLAEELLMASKILQRI